MYFFPERNPDMYGKTMCGDNGAAIAKVNPDFGHASYTFTDKLGQVVL